MVGWVVKKNKSALVRAWACFVFERLSFSLGFFVLIREIELFSRFFCFVGILLFLRSVFASLLD